MKKFIVIVLLLSACGSKDSKKTNTTESKRDTSVVVDSPTSNTIDTTSQNTIDAAAIIGTPVKLGKIEVAANDLPSMNTWDMCKSAAEELGAGWRLPTKDELLEIYKNKDKLGSFASDVYWNSYEKDAFNAGVVQFSNGKEGTFSKVYNGHVRAVRSL